MTLLLSAPQVKDKTDSNQNIDNGGDNLQQ
jgi:hypothetical protein